MNTGIKLSGIAMIAGMLMGCEPAATNEELTQMCQNLVHVRGEVKVPVAAELTAKITAEFDKKEQGLLAWKARDMKGWDEELAARIKRLESNPDEKDDEGNPMTQETLQGMYAKKKAIGAQQFDADLTTLQTDKQQALSEVSNTVKEAQSIFDKNVEECLTAAKTEKVSQSQAQCRINAPDKDTYWNKCR